MLCIFRVCFWGACELPVACAARCALLAALHPVGRIPCCWPVGPAGPDALQRSCIAADFIPPCSAHAVLAFVVWRVVNVIEAFLKVAAAHITAERTRATLKRAVAHAVAEQRRTSFKCWTNATNSTRVLAF